MLNTTTEIEQEQAAPSHLSDARDLFHALSDLRERLRWMEVLATCVDDLAAGVVAGTAAHGRHPSVAADRIRTLANLTHYLSSDAFGVADGATSDGIEERLFPPRKGGVA